jgi:hypothetical protein
MTEKAWVESIKELLEQELIHCPSLNSGFRVSTQCGLPYAKEILTYVEENEVFSSGDINEMRYETDLLIYEEVQKKIKTGRRGKGPGHCPTCQRYRPGTREPV